MFKGHKNRIFLICCWQVCIYILVTLISSKALAEKVDESVTESDPENRLSYGFGLQRSLSPPYLWLSSYMTFSDKIDIGIQGFNYKLQRQNEINSKLIKGKLDDTIVADLANVELSSFTIFGRYYLRKYMFGKFGLTRSFTHLDLGFTENGDTPGYLEGYTETVSWTLNIGVGSHFNTDLFGFDLYYGGDWFILNIPFHSHQNIDLKLSEEASENLTKIKDKQSGTASGITATIVALYFGIAF